MVGKSRMEATDNDKVNTLTHCRFEARSLFNTDKVLVVDFDEFLYCKGALSHEPDGNTAHGQASYIQKVMSERKKEGVQQLLIRQRVVANKTST
jgi:hypothetical protein